MDSDTARVPWRLPGSAWMAVLRRTKDEIKDDRAPLLAAGVAFYGLIATVPVLVTILSLYGLFRDPFEARQEILEFTSALPDQVAELLEKQLLSVVESSSTGLGIGVAIGILGSLWSASSATKHVIESLNAAFDVDETRGFVHLRLLSLAVTAGTAIVVVGGLGAMAVLPTVLDTVRLGGATDLLLRFGRVPLVALVFLTAVALLYRFGPARDGSRWQWVTPGAAVATLAWIASSLGFSIYVTNFGSYEETYGSLGAIIVLGLWMFLTAFSVVLGAELNSELEHQLRLDRTTVSEAATRQAAQPAVPQAARQTGAAVNPVMANLALSAPPPAAPVVVRDPSSVGVDDAAMVAGVAIRNAVVGAAVGIVRKLTSLSADARRDSVHHS